MAVRFKEALDVTRGNIYLFPPEKLKIKPELNGRHELQDIEWLVQSIAKDGQRTPVEIRAEGNGDNKVPILTAGFSRWRAIIDINKRKLTPVPLKIACVYREGNEVDGFVSNIQENRLRRSTTTLDDSHNIARLRRWNMKDEDIAKVYFPDVNGDGNALKKSVAWVRRTVKLVNLAPEAEQAVKEGRVKPSAATHIAEMAAEAQRDLVAKEGKITGADISKAAGKPEKLTVKSAREELDRIISEFAAKLPTDVNDQLCALRDRL